MYTRVGRSYVSLLRLVDPPLGPVGTHPMNKQKVKKRRHLPMCTRTRGYLVVDVITIIMLLMLYAIMLNYVKNLKKNSVCQCVREWWTFINMHDINHDVNDLI